MQKTLQMAIAAVIAIALTACGDATQSDAQAKSGAANFDAISAGTLTATVNGQPHSWTADKRQSEWFGDLDSLLTTASFLSRPSPSNHYPGNLSFSISRTDDNWQANGAEIFLGKPDIFNFSTSNGGGVEFKVTTVEIVGESMKIAGTFNAMMPALYQAGGDPDMTNVLLFEDGTFELALPPRGD